MRIFVTGASGVIGRRVVPQLVAAGHQVSAVARSPAQHTKLEALGARPVPVDLFATAVVAALPLASGAYNVVDDDPVTRRVLGEAVAALLGVRPPRRPVPRWITRLLGSLGELMSRSQRISNRKLREAGDWRPRYPSIREGLRPRSRP